MDSNAEICLKSELDLFSAQPIQLAVEDSCFVEIHPVASLGEKSPIEFYISGSGEYYLDLAYTILNLKVKIVKKNGADIVATDHVAPICYFLNTMFSECGIYLNGKQVASQANHAFRSYLESLLFYSKSAQETLLGAALFSKDTASQHDIVAAAGANSGFNTRQESCKLSQVVDLMGPLHFDLAAQSKLLINGVSVRVKLEKHKSEFALLSANDHFKFVIQSASLFIRKVKVSPSIILAHEKTLESSVLKYPIRRIEIKTFALPSGLQSASIPNAFIGQAPARLIMGLVSNESLNGKINKSPFNFRHYNLNYLCILKGGVMIPSKPLAPNFESKLYARSYLSLFTDLGRYHGSPNINIAYSEYAGGYTLFAFDLTPDYEASSDHVSIAKNENLTIDLKFSTALPETVSLIIYSEYRNTIEIDKSRNVYTDF